MTLSELHTNEELRQHEFPVTARQAYFAHAGVCPLPRRVAEAVSQCALKGAHADQEDAVSRTVFAETRALAAKMIGATDDEIALVGPTSLALSLVAGGLHWHRGDNILIYHDDYPSNVYPWMALASRGVQVRLMNIRELGKIRSVDVLGQADEQTRLVALASCHFIGGWAINIEAIGKALRQRNILFCVDAIQTLGTRPLTVEHIDFLAADSHKWFLGPCSAGLFYVRKELQAKLRPCIYGWHNVRCPDFVAGESIEFAPGAKRYEAGSANLLGVVGLKAALELILEIGLDSIGAEMLRKRKWLVEAIQGKGFTVLHPNAPQENAGAMVSFFQPDADMAVLHHKLGATGIQTSLRSDRQGQHYIRVSPHFYNTDAELNRLIENI